MAAPTPLPIVVSACFVLLMQVPGIASGLAGGVQIGTLGAIGWAADKTKSALGAARPQNVRAYRSVRRDVMAVKAGAAMVTRAVTAPAKWVADRVRLVFGVEHATSASRSEAAEPRSHPRSAGAPPSA
jgi:hypothetical protein